MLIRGDTQISFPEGKEFPVKYWKDVKLSDFEQNRIVISTTPLFNSRDEEYKTCNSLMQLFDKRIGYSYFIFALIREAKYLLYSRIKFSEKTKSTKSTGVDVLTQSRHHGISLGLDSQRAISVDKEIRDLLSYQIYKSLGNMTHEIDPYYFGFWRPEWLANMRPGQFAILSSSGNIGSGYNEMPMFHKRAKENLVRAFGISVKYKEQKKKKDEDEDDEE